MRNINHHIDIVHTRARVPGAVCALATYRDLSKNKEVQAAKVRRG